MPIEVIDNGQNNRFHAETPEDLGNLRLVFNGDNNRVIIGRGCRFISGVIEFGGSCAFEAESDNLFGKMLVYGKNEARIQFGSRNGFTWETTIGAHEPSTIRFGNGCLVASGCNLQSSDMHSVIEIATGKRINPAADIVIGDHVWLGDGVRVLKGACIGSGCIIGAGSIVTSTPLPPNVAAAGGPARIIRHGVSWVEELIRPLASNEG
jgi:acetyltransferase-like isoleucine patch superfamily enzyme